MLGSLIHELAQEEDEPEAQKFDKQIEGSNHEVAVPGNCKEFFGGSDQYEPEEIEMKSQKDNYPYTLGEDPNFIQNDTNNQPENDTNN